MLEQMQVLTRIDVNALARYCRLWSRWRKAEKFIEEKGEVYTLKDEKGNVRCVQPFTQVAIANKLAQQLTRLEQEFGMTPSARTRIQVTPAPIPAIRTRSRVFITGGLPTRDRAEETRPAG
jgi:P27 family predicted phage terminase small subunit